MHIHTELRIFKHDLYLWKVEYRVTSGMLADTVELTIGEVINTTYEDAIKSASESIRTAIVQHTNHLMRGKEQV